MTAGPYGVFDAVENVHDRMRFAYLNFLDSLGNAWSIGGKYGGILRKQFDDDGLRLAGEVANHVLEDLHEFDLGGGLSLLNFLADIVHDFFDAALASALELDGEVAAIGFGNGGKT